MPFGTEKVNQTIHVEHVFTTGGDLGHGTQGLGEETARAATAQLERDTLKDYWTTKRRVVAERKAQEITRLERISSEQRRSPRQRLMAAYASREKEIQRMIVERKQFERDFQQKREEEAKEKHEVIVANKQDMMRMAAEARLIRKEKKRRELEEIHAQRAELLQLREAERREEEKLAISRAELLKAQAERERKQAEEEAAVRLEAAKKSVEGIKVAQREKSEKTQVNFKDIEDLKATSIKEFHVRDRLARRIFDVRQTSLDVNAKRQREQLKQRQELRKKKEEERTVVRRSEATKLKEIMKERRQQHIQEKQKQFELLRSEAQKLKERSEKEIAEELERRKKEHEEYIALVKDVLNRKQSPSGGSSNNSPSRARHGPPSP